MRDPGTYALVIPLEAGLCLRIGGLGVRSLPPGCYVYVGSALGGLSGRLRHHLAVEKTLRWHIDYLLAEAPVARIWYARGTQRLECIWDEVLLSMPAASSPVPRFGASDCRCRSHLTLFPAMPSLAAFTAGLEQAGLRPVHLVEEPAVGAEHWSPCGCSSLLG